MRSPPEMLNAAWRMSAVRHALVTTAFFLLVLAVVATVVVLAVRNTLVSGIDDALAASISDILADDESDDIDDLVERVAAIAGSPVEGRIAALLDANGRVMVGDPIPPPPAAARWTFTVGEDRVRGRQVSFGAHRLVLGRSLEPADETIEILVAALMWGGFAAALVTLAGGVALGVTAQRRISRIGTALQRVASGELDARLPHGGSGDDIARIADAMNRAIARLETSVTSLRDLSANIAHDLKTPITRLLTRLEAIASSLDGPAAGNAAAAVEEARQIAETFDAVLRISQLEAGARRDRFRPTDLRGVLTKAAGLHADDAEAQHRPFVVDTGDDPVVVDGDEPLLVQLVSNLIANAMTHTSAGTDIEMALAKDSGGVRMTVADRGPGLAQEDRARALERFYRAERSRSTPGAGLGLAIVTAIAGLHHAEVTLHDNGPGLRVEIAFPYPAARDLPARRMR